MTDTTRIDRQVRLYKEATNNKIKEKAWNEITTVLASHIRAIKSLLLGYEDPTVSQKVKAIVLSNMMASTSIQNVDDFLNYIRQNVQLAGYTHEDVEQLIYLTLIKLINSYKYEKISFLQFATFLLPRRVVQDIYKSSKDQLAQMEIIMDCTENNELVNKLIIDDEDQFLDEYTSIIYRLNEQIQCACMRHKRRKTNEESNPDG